MTPSGKYTGKCIARIYGDNKLLAEGELEFEPWLRLGQFQYLELHVIASGRPRALVIYQPNGKWGYRQDITSNNLNTEYIREGELVVYKAFGLVRA